MADSETGFLGRWARRKTDVLQGKPVAEAPARAVSVPAVVVAAQQPGPHVQTPASDSVPAAVTELPELSLEDVKLLTKDSDFAPYMARSVDSNVRNAAMKKLFEDPHFNVMDGLDIYIDDYSIADPIPESMLRQMVSSKFLNLFNDEEDTEASVARDNQPMADSDTTATAELLPSPQGENAVVRPTGSSEALAVTLQVPTPEPLFSAGIAFNDIPSHPELTVNSEASQHHHADPYLRLQPNHAAPNPPVGIGNS